MITSEILFEIFKCSLAIIGITICLIIIYAIIDTLIEQIKKGIKK